ncbi:MAG: hypothetical protein ACYCYO_08340 [Bacilli bacterium]
MQTNQQKLDLLRDFYDSIPDDELKTRLQKAGFEIIDDVPGQVLIEDPEFVVIGTVRQPQYKTKNEAEFFSSSHLLGVVA